MLSNNHKDPLLDDLCQLIRIPSRSSAEGGEEGEVQRFVAERMRELGARVRTFEAKDIPEFWTHPLCCGPDRNYEDRPTVIGELGPKGGPALLVMAHSDTVQISNPDEWEVDPFGGVVREDAIWGLGAGDDKWGTATMLTIMRALQDSGGATPKRLIFVSSMDEENGIGNGTLLMHMAGIKADQALYLDGTNMTLTIGHMGGSYLHLRAKTAIAKAAMARHKEIVEAACRDMSSRREPLYDRPFYTENVTREWSVRFVAPEFFKFSAAGRPAFVLAFYTFPEESRSSICAELEKGLSDAMGDDVSLYRISYYEPWFEPSLIPEATPIVRHMAAATREVLGHEPVVTVGSKQDSFVLRNLAGIPTISFGVSRYNCPGGAHTPNERVLISDAWNGCCIAYDAVCRWLPEPVS